jgi:iron complex outermembrane receptor protein
VDRNEKSTPAYQLFDLALGSTLKIKKQQLIIGFQVQNVLNTAYLQHLSRYRLLNLPEQGRNFVLMLKIPFELRLEK